MSPPSLLRAELCPPGTGLAGGSGQAFGSDQVLTGDVDGDGRMEVVLIGSRTDASTVISILHVQESGVETLNRFCDERRGNAADVADLDGDGKAEIVVGYQLSGMGIYTL